MLDRSITLRLIRFWIYQTNQVCSSAPTSPLFPHHQSKEIILSTLTTSIHAELFQAFFSIKTIMDFLLPARACYPPTMLRPEESLRILCDLPNAKNKHTQILTNLWEELERSLGGSEASKNTIAKIEAESAVVRKIACRRTPRSEHKAELRDQRVIQTYPHFALS